MKDENIYLYCYNNDDPLQLCKRQYINFSSWSSYKKHKQLLVNEIKIWMSRYDEIIKSKKLNELTTFLHENYFSCNGLKRVLFDGE